MGISYEHWFVVRDLDWRPAKKHGEAIHRLLVDWGLVREKPKLFAVDEGHEREVQGAAVVRDGAIPDELWMRYSPMVEGEAAERVVGPLEEESVPEARPFIWAITVVLGRDYKIIDAPDFGPVSTSLVGGRRPTHAVGAIDAVAATWDQPPPPTEVAFSDPMTGDPREVPDGFVGLMRSGVIFDCDRARPEFPRSSDSRLPNREFVRALEGALETGVIEIGRYV